MITDLRLQNYRSYLDESFETSQSVNIIVGPNASGKTNLLEALLVAATGSSYRARDIDLINSKKQWLRIDIDLDDGSHRTIKIENSPLPTKTYLINNTQHKRLSLDKALPVVLFEPNHLLMLSGGPERRRDYMDDILEKTTPGYGTLRRQYKRTLSQRNSLLKHGRSTNIKDQVFPWNIKLSQLGGQIVKRRTDLIGVIAKKLNLTYKQISGSKTKLTIDYVSEMQPSVYESAFLKKLEANLSNDIDRGFTSFGPHREDFCVLFDGKTAQEAASRGEVRTAVLALKIIELELIAEYRQLAPILLLDDVFSELDGRRRQALTDHLTSYQVFITTTDADLVIQHFTAKSHIIPLG